MPRPRAGEGHVGCYKRSGSLLRNAPALCRGRLRDELRERRGVRQMRERVAASGNNVARQACSNQRENTRRKVTASESYSLVWSVAANVKLRDIAASEIKEAWSVATNVRLRDARSRHPQKGGFVCSCEREAEASSRHREVESYVCTTLCQRRASVCVLLSRLPALADASCAPARGIG